MYSNAWFLENLKNSKLNFNVKYCDCVNPCNIISMRRECRAGRAVAAGSTAPVSEL